MLLYIDLKTTGFEENDRICAVSLILVSEGLFFYQELIKAPKKIRSEASVLHNITNEMLLNKAVFQDAKIAKILKQYNHKENIFVGHNIKFIITMLQKEGFTLQAGVIDTLKCSRALMQDCEQFSLQYLRYDLKLYKEEYKLAEELGIDLVECKSLNDPLYIKSLHHCLNEFEDDEKLLEISVNPVLLQKLSFGKYKGNYIEEIAANDKNYLLWILNNFDELDEDLLYSIQYYLKLL